MSNFKGFWYPQNLAIIGVSTKSTNWAQNIFYNTIDFGYKGNLIPIGSSGGEILGKKIYKSVDEVDCPIDMAAVLVPAKFCPSTLESLGKKGCKFVVIESAGFREFGGDVAMKLENSMIEIANKYGIRFIGPNCIGLINVEIGMALPFPRMKKNVKHGIVSMVSQSGGVGMSLINMMSTNGIGLNKFASIGNSLNVCGEDLLEYLITDETTKIILLYLESIQNGKRMFEIAKKSPKPIMVFKSNCYSTAAKIAASHTASLSSDDGVVDAAFKQAGISRVHSEIELINLMKAFHLPLLKGKKLAIISRSGGHAIISADSCERFGFKLAELPEEFLRECEKNFKAGVVKLTNPLDLGDLYDLDVYQKILEETLAMDEVDGVCFLHTSLAASEHAATKDLFNRLSNACIKSGKPVAAYLAIPPDEFDDINEGLKIPIFTNIVEMFESLVEHHKQSVRIMNLTKEINEIEKFNVEQDKVNEIIKTAQNEKRDLLLNEAFDVFKYYGCPVLGQAHVINKEDAVKEAEKLGYPCVMKIVSEQVSHKSDAGGVKLNLKNSDDIRKAWDEMFESVLKLYPDLKDRRVLIQPMAQEGHELIIGGKQDKTFGPIILVGLGGIYVEIFKQAEMKISPLTRKEATEMIENMKGYAILKGCRGQPKADINSVIDVILKISQLLVEHPEIKELDCNPLRVFQDGKGCLALDARMILEK